ncbi:MAG TPA: folylpolyglutamate synthase/dihydrofolate synthase family protein [Candidatus Saccharimonadales bacterium]|nr:folylpolyglutamate synthase/dihydrofolate synthase family protein [Candidatus Saccharimonadales bacterium]
MPPSYESAVANLLALGAELVSHRKFDLDHMRRLATALGHPERRFQSVLIAGTNGKGSTAATLAAIAQAAGYRTGLYTSPHLQQINERLQIDQEPVSNAEFAEIYERVDTAAQQLVREGSLPWYPSFFEMVTGMMFEYFASMAVELAVLEVGMGGRLDATNIVDPCISVITDIDLDHQKFLGNTLPEIAREKAGILRRGGVAVLLPQHPQVNDALGHALMEIGARPVSAVKHMPPVTPGAAKYHASGPEAAGHNRFSLAFMGNEIAVDSPLAGRHQLRNLSLAITAAEQLNSFGFKILGAHVEEGARLTRWPGRFQVIPGHGDLPEIVLDVAHNPAGAWALRSALSTFYEDAKLTFVFGAMRDKAIGEIADIIFPLAERVVATRVLNPRAASTQEIAEAAAHSGTVVVETEDVQAAIERAQELAGKNGVVVITGSIYIVGEALGVLAHGHTRQSV